jgi:hypothetical protein
VGQGNKAGVAVAIFGPGVGSTPIEHRVSDLIVPAEMNFDRWTVGGLRLEQDLKFQNARIHWQSPEASIDYTFESSHPPYSYAADPRGCPSYCADDRIEQSGRIRGHLTIGTRRIDFDGMGHRDHSWGARDWMAMQHYQWYLGQAGEGTAIHYWNLQALGEVQLRGYVFKDRLMAMIQTMQVRVNYDDQFWQQGYTADIVDSAGRTTTLSTKVFGHHTLISDPRMRLHESAGRSIIDAKEGVSWLECAWPKDYLEHIRTYGPYRSR